MNAVIYWLLGVLWVYLALALVLTRIVVRHSYDMMLGRQPTGVALLLTLNRISIWRVFENDYMGESTKRRNRICRAALLLLMLAILAFAVIRAPAICVAVSYFVPVLLIVSVLHLLGVIFSLSGREFVSSDGLAVNERVRDPNRSRRETGCFLLPIFILLIVLSIVALFLGWNRTWQFVLPSAGLAVYYLLYRLLSAH